MTGIFPTDWKFARVVPIPKSGNPDNPSNYRPISTLPIISKLYWKNMYIISSVNTLVRTVYYLQTSGVLLRVNQPQLPFSHLCMNVKRLRIMEVKSVLCFFYLCKAFDSVPQLWSGFVDLEWIPHLTRSKHMQATGYRQCKTKNVRCILVIVFWEHIIECT